MPEQDQSEAELHHSQEVLGMVLVTNPETTKVVQPGKQSLDLPAPFIPTQATTVLSLLRLLRLGAIISIPRSLSFESNLSLS
jgi:hypothetical protein